MATAPTAAAAKKAMRQRIAASLRAVEDAEITRQSEAIAARIVALPAFQQAATLSVYLHMPKEASTRALLLAAFHHGKKVYVPKITGKNAEDMAMLHALDLEDIDAFPKDKWKIPDPPLTYASGEPRGDAIDALDLDLVLMPGVAFDRRGGRLGHGKGYYDSFLRRLADRSEAAGRTSRPIKVGLCLTDQLVDAVPLSPHDRMLDMVVTPDELILSMRRAALALLCVCMLAACAMAEDLYELLGVSSSVTPAQLKKVYRKLSLKYHPDKQTPETKDEMMNRFVKITNAYRVLSDPDRREKYDLYGIADEQGFKNFDDAFRFAHDGVEDSWANWIGLVAVLAVGIIPIVVMQRNRVKPVKKRREALRSLSRNRLTAASTKTFSRQFSKTRRQYLKDPTHNE
ncbi:hypothetical protein ATCC90586_005124 [Pythium insidiosum]|nr:hypothetical protein ATCC90586_005124 [Pythium insidiosum]